MKTFVAAVLMVAAGVLTAPSGAAGQVAGCGEYVYECGDPGFHYIQEQYNGTWNNVHLECLSSDPWPHRTCIVEEEDLQVAFDAAVAAIFDGDLERLVATHGELGGRLTFNAERGSLQLRALCEPNTIIANVPIPGSLLGVVSAQLQ